MRLKKSELENKISTLSATTANYIRIMEKLIPKLMNLANAYKALGSLEKKGFIKLFFGENLKRGMGAIEPNICTHF